MLFFESDYHDEAKEEKSNIEKKSNDESQDLLVDTQENEPLLDLGTLSMGDGSGDMSSIKLLGDIFSDKESEEKWSKEWEDVFAADKESPSKTLTDLLSQDAIAQDDLTANANCLPSALLSQLQKGSSNDFLSKFGTLITETKYFLRDIYSLCLITEDIDHSPLASQSQGPSMPTSSKVCFN